MNVRSVLVTGFHAKLGRVFRGSDSRRRVPLLCLRALSVSGVDYQAVRAQVSLAEVLELLVFVAGETSGDQVEGPVPSMDRVRFEAGLPPQISAKTPIVALSVGQPETNSISGLRRPNSHFTAPRSTSAGALTGRYPESLADQTATVNTPCRRNREEQPVFFTHIFW